MNYMYDRNNDRSLYSDNTLAQGTANGYLMNDFARVPPYSVDFGPGQPSWCNYPKVFLPGYGVIWPDPKTMESGYRSHYRKRRCKGCWICRNTSGSFKQPSAVNSVSDLCDPQNEPFRRLRPGSDWISNREGQDGRGTTQAREDHHDTPGGGGSVGPTERRRGLGCETPMGGGTFGNLLTGSTSARGPRISLGKRFFRGWRGSSPAGPNQLL